MLCMPEDVREMEFLPQRTRGLLQQVQEKLERDTPEEDALYECLRVILDFQDLMVKARSALAFADRTVDVLFDKATVDLPTGKMYRHHKELVRWVLGECKDKAYEEED